MAQSDLLRIGRISSFDYPKGTANITYEDRDDSTTAMFSLLAWEYWLPAVGDQVIVAHISTGSCAAVILGPVWHDGLRPAEGFEGLYRKEYYNEQGVAYERYDANAQAFSQNVTGTMEIKASYSWTLKVGACTIVVDSGGSIRVTAPGGVTVTAPSVDVSGDVNAGGIRLQKHTHPCPHGGRTGNPA